MIKQLQNFALKTYWINKHINHGKRKYFNELFLPDFIETISSKFSIADDFDLDYAFSQSPVKGLISSMFDPNQHYFNSLDLSVAINIAINGYCNPQYTSNENIIDSANFICEELKKRIYDDKILTEYLKEIHKELSQFDYYVEGQEIQNVLSDKLLIFRTYFSRFENSGCTHAITIYHQSKDNTWIDWSSENTITIKHHCKGFNEGFFLFGFDYQLSTGERLRIASREDGAEYFNPEKSEWAKNTIWAA
ncbi:hypothetical protein LVD15_23370 [Fulvivirga maritima]|uniref:hypothetical protein n=1 Tax=Fulvivirga maritima TaxID=2904247 RepID=UPI001F41B40A|nr:hypothetical protein [Fulvivirga maritima]UII26208.1 hypothetical protein LVD15_23370 [Fulvivirga maritima]